jgi:hypothetical protein
VLFFGGKNEMKRRTILILALVVFLAFSTFASNLAFAGYLYGISYDFSNPHIPEGVPYLCRIDPTNGNYVTVSQAPPIWGMAYNNSDRYLYGMGSNTDGLFRINPADGSYDVISVPGVPEVTHGLAYNTSNGYLYGEGSPKRITIPGNGYLFRIDLTDSSYNFVSTAPGYVMGLTYNSSNGYLYGMNGSYLYRIDPTDGSSTQVSAEPGFVLGLTFNSSDGYLYGLQSHSNWPNPPDNTPGRLYRIDPASGSYVLVSDNSAPNVTALAYVPETATLLLLALGSLLVTRQRRQ